MNQVPYHGPHVVLSMDEAAAIWRYMNTLDNEGVEDALKSALEKIDWALHKSHPNFLKPAS